MILEYLLSTLATPLVDESRALPLAEMTNQEAADAFRIWLNRYRRYRGEGHGEFDFKFVPAEGRNSWYRLELSRPYPARVGVYFERGDDCAAKDLRTVAQQDRYVCVVVIQMGRGSSGRRLQAVGSHLTMEPEWAASLLLHQAPPITAQTTQKAWAPVDNVHAVVRWRIRTVTETQALSLDLSNLGLTTPPAEIFSLTWITQLNLAGNFFESLPDDIQNLPRLSYLDLSRNKLDGLPSVMAQLDALRFLDISQNMMTSFPACVARMHRLEELNLNYNGIREVPDDVRGMQALRRLSASGCGLTKFPSGVLALTELLDLDLARNYLTELPQRLDSLRSIKKLNVYANRIRTLPAAVAQLAFLDHLNIDSNDIAEIPESVDLRPPLLTRLLCADNPMSELDLRERLTRDPPPRLGEGEKIGLGGFSVVERVEVRPGQFVARKVFQYGGRDSQDYEALARKRFVAGAHLMQDDLHHPNIAEVFTVRGDLKYPYFEMEYFPEGDFRAWLSQAERAASEWAPILLDVCEALKYAHSLGYSHRDVKPENVLLRATGERLRGILADFDLAHHAAIDWARSMHRHITVFTPIWIRGMPSLLVGQFGPLMDVHGVAAMVYYCMVLDPPYPHMAKRRLESIAEEKPQFAAIANLIKEPLAAVEPAQFFLDLPTLKAAISMLLEQTSEG